MSRAISCYFGPSYTVPLHVCVACQDRRRSRKLWRPPFWYWAVVPPVFLKRGPFAPLSRVCRDHTVTKKHRREAPYIP